MPNIAIKAENLSKAYQLDETHIKPYSELLLAYKTIPSLNGWRAIAILLVIIGHLKKTLQPTGMAYKILDNIIFAEFGVRIFFVLSGFLITTLLIKEKKKTGKINITNFFIRRILRIVPVLWAYLIIVAILNQLFEFNLTLSHFIGPFLYINNFNFLPGTWILGHTWSLAVEEQFYLIWPFIFKYVNKKLSFCLILIILIPFINVLAYLNPKFIVITLQPFFKHAAAIFIGAILSILWAKNFYGFNVKKYLTRNIFIISIILTFLINIAQYHGKFGIILLPAGDFILNTCIAYMILFSILKNTAVYKILNTSIVISIGILSYSIYIWQQLFLIPYKTYAAWSEYFFFPFNLVVIGIVAYLSYHYLEKPFLKLKQRFSFKNV
ncbi:acyltransferase [Pedobacter sp.]|uniref:acyltransferase family protein n=1 Tax=Pedobacter sp. TaxID=1411316 RepID=UPI0031D70833